MKPGLFHRTARTGAAATIPHASHGPQRRSAGDRYAPKANPCKALLKVTQLFNVIAAATLGTATRRTLLRASGHVDARCAPQSYPSAQRRHLARRDNGGARSGTAMPRFIALCTVLLAFAHAPVAIAAESPQDTWIINLKDTDLKALVQQVAAITGKTFVLDPRVKGKVTVISSEELDRDGIYQLFLSVLRVNGFAAIPAGDVIKIRQATIVKQGPEDSSRKPGAEDFVTRVIPAENVSSQELLKLLRPLVPQHGHLASIDNPNVVIVSDYAQNIRRLVKMVRSIDVADNQKISVVQLEEAWVGDIAELLERMLPDQIGRAAKGPQRVQAIANERNNTLLLRGHSGPVAEIRALIEELDQPATTSGATFVIQLAHADATAVAEIVRGIVTAEPAEAGANGAGERSTPVTIQADESLNAIVVRADPAEMADIKSLVSQLDIRRLQVLIEAAIVEVSLNGTDLLGVDLAAGDANGEQVPLISTALTPSLANLLAALQPVDDVDTGNPNIIGGLASLSQPSIAVAKISLDGLSFGAIIQALSTASEANLLSTPSITTLDNEEAEIVVGQNVPFRTGSFTTSTNGGNNPFTTIQREDVGITLKVTPHIHDGSVVRLEIEQEVSSVVQDPGSDAGFSDVVTNKRTITTTVLADDRETIVLGGLIQDDTTNTERKVPLLGDIPILGRLFTNTSAVRNRRNLLVFLRPTVMHDKSDVSRVTQEKYNHVWEINGPLPASAISPIEGIFAGEKPNMDAAKETE